MHISLSAPIKQAFALLSTYEERFISSVFKNFRVAAYILVNFAAYNYINLNK